MSAVISLSREECLRLHESMRREWLETDGRGGFASSTVLLCPTRRYHGLLLASVDGHPKRHSFLSRFEEDVRGGERDFPLSMARYPGTWMPQGHQGILEFELVPYPSWRYQLGGVEVAREILMVRGEPVVLCRYVAHHAMRGLELRLRPLLTCREADRADVREPRARPSHRAHPGRHPRASLPRAAADRHHRRRRARRASRPTRCGTARSSISATSSAATTVTRTSGARAGSTCRSSRGREIVVAVDLGDAGRGSGRAVAPRVRAAARGARALASSVSDGLEAMLHLGADDFLFRDREGRLGVIAGFPWFGEWGRDTFVSLPGSHARARARRGVRRGARGSAALPRRRPAARTSSARRRETSVYGSLDTPLWFAWAVEAYDEAGGDSRRVDDALLPAVEEIARALLDGNRPGAICDDDRARHARGPEPKA